LGNFAAFLAAFFAERDGNPRTIYLVAEWLGYRYAETAFLLCVTLKCEGVAVIAIKLEPRRLLFQQRTWSRTLRQTTSRILEMGGQLICVNL